MADRNPKELSALAALQQNQVLRQGMDRIYSDLVVSQPKGKLPEEIFVKHFLPYFSGKTTENSERLMGEWIGIAGNATAEVDVFNSKGEVIFTVPSMMNSNALDISNRKVGDTVGEMISNYKLREAHVPGSGRNYLDHVSAEKVEKMVDRNAIPTTESEQRWANILHRYGVGPANSVSNVGTTAAANDGVDDLEY